MRPSSVLRSLWPAGILIAVLIAANWNLIDRRASPPFDGAALFGPHHHLIAAFAAEGRWLSWDPWTNAGTPEYAEPEYGAYSPLVLLTGYIGNRSEAGYRLYWLLVWAIGGLGVMVLGRYLRAPRWGACACAIAFAMSGFYIGNAENTPMLYATSCLPWLIWRADVAMQRRSWLAAGQAGAILGASALGGYPGLVILNAGYVTLWTFGRLLTGRAPRTSRSRPVDADARAIRRWIGVMVMIATISAIVMAAAYVPFFVDAAGFASRTGALPRDVAVYNDALVPAALLTAASPAITLLFPMDTDMSMRNVYLGTLAPMMATLALSRLCCSRSRNRSRSRSSSGSGSRGRSRAQAWRFWVALLAILSLACALATIFPLRGWLYDCCVPFRYFRHAALFRVYLLFSVTVLALYGFRDFAARARQHQLRLAPRAACATMLLPSVIALAALATVFTRYPHASRSAEAHGLLMWMLAPLLALAISRRGMSPAACAAVIAFAAVDGIWAAQLAGPMLHQADAGWYQRSEMRHHDLDLTRRGLTRRVEDLFNTNLWNKVPTLRNYSAFTNGWYATISKHPVFERAASRAQRIFFVDGARTPPIVAANERVLASLLDRATALNKPVLVLQEPRELMSPAKPGDTTDTADTADTADIDRRIDTLPPAEPIDVQLDRYEPDELTFSTTTRAAGWLLVTDRWARGWKATINGAPTPVLVGDFVFRAVQVPAGRVQVRFTYEKSHGLWLVALSWSTCAMFLLIAPVLKLVALFARQTDA
jgi:hypothetical protein